MAVTICEEDPAQADIIPLLRNGEAEAAKLYPAESNHHLPLGELRGDGVRFFVARDLAGRAVATGAIVAHGGWAEIKRMWVEENARGRGIARRLLDTLIAQAGSAGLAVIRLETGAASFAALALYESAGFKRRGPFGNYQADPLSVFMERTLQANVR